MFCWLIGHNWVGGFDPHFQSCTRCGSVRPKKFPGTVECSYCSRPVNKPPPLYYTIKYEQIVQCPHCGKKTRWTRKESWDAWSNPVLVIDFKMEIGE
jgi:DNA-directed RNA polymerase subunit RPC12/RpoP